MQTEPGQVTDQPLPQSRQITTKESFLQRFLDPVDRMVEGIYSVLIVLTFTMAFRVIQANTALGQQAASAAVMQLFVAAFGCAVAWGILDGVMYVLTSMLERSQQHRMIVAIRDTADEEQGVALVADELDDVLVSVTDAGQRESLYRGVYRRLRGTVPPTTHFRKEDLAGGLATAIIAALAALPIVLPLLFFRSSPILAVRLSNLIAFGLLYWMGYGWGKYIGAVPWKIGLGLLLVGLLMVVIAIPLGG